MWTNQLVTLNEDLYIHRDHKNFFDHSKLLVDNFDAPNRFTAFKYSKKIVSLFAMFIDVLNKKIVYAIVILKVTFEWSGNSADTFHSMRYFYIWLFFFLFSNSFIDFDLCFIHFFSFLHLFIFILAYFIHYYFLKDFFFFRISNTSIVLIACYKVSLFYVILMQWFRFHLLHW